MKVYDLNGNIVREITLPQVFRFHYRPDLIQRAVLVIQSNRRQPYGSDPLAGGRTSAHYHGIGKGYGAMKNRETARMARIHGKGMPGLIMTARFVPQARKGRESHPPKAEKIWSQKINNKERILALKSAIAATSMFDLVSKRHRIEKIDLPIIVSDEVESVKKTKDLKKLFETIKINNDLDRAKEVKVRAGRGKMRGRRYKKKKSFLIVVNENKGIINAAKNLAGVDVCTLRNLNAELLAPGTQPGRLTLWSESAIKKLSEMYG